MRVQRGRFETAVTSSRAVRKVLAQAAIVPRAQERGLRGRAGLPSLLDRSDPAAAIDGARFTYPRTELDGHRQKGFVPRPLRALMREQW